MINKEKVIKLVEEWLQDKDYFLVDTAVSPDNKIVVEIDHKEGVWMVDCADLSRYIEQNLNRDDEDYELEVGSAGIGQPFKVKAQYINHAGCEVELADKQGKKWKGILKEADEQGCTLAVEQKVKHEGDKRPKKELQDLHFNYEDIKEARHVIRFK